MFYPVGKHGGMGGFMMLVQAPRGWAFVPIRLGWATSLGWLVSLIVAGVLLLLAGVLFPDASSSNQDAASNHASAVAMLKIAFAVAFTFVGTKVVNRMAARHLHWIRDNPELASQRKGVRIVSPDVVVTDRTFFRKQIVTLHWENHGVPQQWKVQVRVQDVHSFYDVLASHPFVDVSTRVTRSRRWRRVTARLGACAGGHALTRPSRDGRDRQEAFGEALQAPAGWFGSGSLFRS